MGSVGLPMNSMQRILKITQALKNGETYSIDELSQEYGKHRETIKRDIGMIRESLTAEGIELIYRHHDKKYEARRTEHIRPEQIFAILSVLHGSRTLSREEMKQMEETFSKLISKESQIRLKRMIASFQFHYHPRTNEPLLPNIELLLESIISQTALDITYVTAKSEKRHLRIAPFSIVFDEGYFYVVVRTLHNEANDEMRLNLRIDRIISMDWTELKFTIPQHGADYFKPGEYANKSAKMYSGERSVKIKLRMQSHVVSYFEDKFPVHTLIDKTKQTSTYEFEVMHEDGAIFWILSERDWVEVLEPLDLRMKIKAIIFDMAKRYE
jgi:predicted DNA-binding transcriptional regulator YafY